LDLEIDVFGVHSRQQFTWQWISCRSLSMKDRRRAANPVMSVRSPGSRATQKRLEDLVKIPAEIEQILEMRPWY